MAERRRAALAESARLRGECGSADVEPTPFRLLVGLTCPSCAGRVEVDSYGRGTSTERVIALRCVESPFHCHEPFAVRVSLLYGSG